MTAQEAVKEKDSPTPMVIVPEEAKTLFAWKAPMRPFKRRSREYFTTLGAIVFLVVVILVFLKEWLLIGVVGAVGFVTYVLATVPPHEEEHTVTNKGIRTGERFYPWEWLQQFWFTDKLGEKLLLIQTKIASPRRLLLVLREVEEEKVKETLSKYMIADKPEETWLEKAGVWLQKKFPLDSE